MASKFKVKPPTTNEVLDKYPAKFEAIPEPKKKLTRQPKKRWWRR